MLQYIHVIKEESMKRLTTEDYIEKATEVHGNRYDYSDTVYKTP